MDIKLINFDDFKTELRNTYSLDDPEQTFINFLLNIKDVYFNLKNEIRNYSINTEKLVFSNFSKLVIEDLDGINTYKKYKKIETIKPWIEKYNFRYEGIDSILQIVIYPELYKEEGCPQIYHDLYGKGITNTLEPYGDELFAVQDDFLKFTKANLIDDIISCLNKEFIIKEEFETIQWKGTPTELTALIKALIESEMFSNSLSEKQIKERFEHFFKNEIKHYDQAKSKIRKRTKDLTPFIDKLKTNLERWIKEKD